MARLTSDPGGPVTRGELRSRMHARGYVLTESRIRRMEAGEDRYGLGYDAYESALGMEPGRMRAPIDTVCRTFPESPRDKGARDEQPDVDSLSALAERVEDPATRSSHLLQWARAMGQSHSCGYPLRLLDPILDTLISELGRSIGSAYPMRYEALVQLRSGPYAAAVLRAGQRSVADEHVQALFDIFSAVSDHPTPDAVEWFLRCLCDSRPHVVRGAVIAITNAATVAAWGRPEWQLVTPRILTAWSENADTSHEHRQTLDGLLVSLPTSIKREIRSELPRLPAGTERDRPKGRMASDNPSWAVSTAIARQICDDVDLEPQPMLARLIFEIIFDHREPRAVCALFLLASLPFWSSIFDALLCFALRRAEPETALHTMERLAAIQSAVLTPQLANWASGESPNAEIQRATLRAQAGLYPESETLRRLLDVGGFSARRGLYCSGLSGDPALRRYARSADPVLAGASRWWLRAGPRVVDRPFDGR